VAADAGVASEPEEERLSGDLVGSRQGRLTRTPGFLNWDTAVDRESIRRLPHEGVAWLCPAHGLPVPATALADFHQNL